MDEVELLESNPRYAHIRYADGRESTVSLRDLAPAPLVESKETSSTQSDIIPEQDYEDRKETECTDPEPREAPVQVRRLRRERRAPVRLIEQVEI